MKRDMDFIRSLLLRIEGGEYAFGTLTDAEALNFGFAPDPLRLSQEESFRLRHHLNLLLEVGFVRFEPPQPYQESGIWRVSGMTWKGHDFLDSIRDPAIWAKTKDGAKAAGGFTAEILGALAKGFIKTQIEKQTGVELSL